MITVARYFNAEKLQCAIGIIIGIVSIATALWLLHRFKNPLYSGISYSFTALSIILLAICISVVIRSPKDARRVEQMIQMDLSKIKTVEIPRMEKVIRSFSLVIWIEVCCIILGLSIYFLLPLPSLWKGIGIGLFIQAAILFVFDFIAHNRGKIYLDYLRALN